ncbi:DUF3043 domain-containing protein [Propionicicella superfundia]|uniref:DUF3043 domain-containing protein n=1 Tax=Propionicicella superfundia TaxID=348582 RepID=UPI00146CE06B|nr:DUF3043 domain-containing protein [Propionicicella superfundia]
MGLFSPYKRNDAEVSTSESETVEEAAPSGRTKKATPTPSRKEAEAARRERVRPQLSPKQAKAREREAAREARIRSMDAADAAPGRTSARDWVDSHWMLSEFLMPVLLVTILITLVGQQVWGTGAVAVQVMQISMFVSYGLLFATVIEIWLHWRLFKRFLRERHPGESPKGLLFYFVNRAIAVRRLRQPRPVYKRGDKL